MNRRSVLARVGLWSWIAIASFTQPACAAGGESVEVVPIADPLAVEVAPVISRWRASVSAHDGKGIVEFALPEFRAAISRDLKSDASTLTKELYFGHTALASFFERPLRWTILRHRELESSGRGTTVCYYDPSLLDEAKMRTDASLLGVQDRRAVRCFFLFFADGRWFMSFDFAYKD